MRKNAKKKDIFPSPMEVYVCWYREFAPMKKHPQMYTRSILLPNSTSSGSELNSRMKKLGNSIIRVVVHRENARHTRMAYLSVSLIRPYSFAP